VFKSTGEATLIVPESELEFAEESWVEDIRPNPAERLDGVRDPHGHLERLLREVG